VWDYVQGHDTSPSVTEFIQILVLAQPLTQWVQGALSPGIKRPGRDPDHLSNAKVKNM
jgi:hypothetical protein